jgi:hypothetical protein
MGGHNMGGGMMGGMGGHNMGGGMMGGMGESQHGWRHDGSSEYSAAWAVYGDGSHLQITGWYVTIPC